MHTFSSGIRIMYLGDCARLKSRQDLVLPPTEYPEAPVFPVIQKSTSCIKLVSNSLIRPEGLEQVADGYARRGEGLCPWSIAV